MSATTALRRIILLVLLTAAGGAALAWWRERAGMALPAEPPEWPPLPPDASADASGPDRNLPGSERRPPRSGQVSADAARVTWAEPNDDGSCPAGFPVKAKESSGIYHVPDGRFYDRTNADRCYADPAAAEADGYRRAKA